MQQFAVAVIASLIAGIIIVLWPHFRRGLTYFGRLRKTEMDLEVLRGEVHRQQEVLRVLRDLLFSIPLPDCDPHKVRRAVSTRNQWRRPAVTIHRLTDDGRVLRISRGSNHGIIPGMKVRVSSLSVDGSYEDYVLQPADVERNYSCIRLALLFVPTSAPGLEASFLETNQLTPSEKALVDAINLIESGLPQ